MLNNLFHTRLGINKIEAQHILSQIQDITQLVQHEQVASLIDSNYEFGQFILRHPESMETIVDMVVSTHKLHTWTQDNIKKAAYYGSRILVSDNNIILDSFFDHSQSLSQGLNCGSRENSSQSIYSINEDCKQSSNSEYFYNNFEVASNGLLNNQDIQQQSQPQHDDQSQEQQDDKQPNLPIPINLVDKLIQKKDILNRSVLNRSFSIEKNSSLLQIQSQSVNSPKVKIKLKYGEKLLDVLMGCLVSTSKLEPTTIAYFCEIVDNLMNQRTTPMMAYFFKNHQLIDQMISYCYEQSMVDLLIKLVTIELSDDCERVNQKVSTDHHTLQQYTIAQVVQCLNRNGDIQLAKGLVKFCEQLSEISQRNNAYQFLMNKLISDDDLYIYLDNKNC